MANNRKDLADRFPDGVIAKLRKFRYDTALAASPSALAPLMRLVPASQVMFGTDFPFATAANTARGLSGYGFSADDLAAIDRNNILKLIPSLA